MTFSEFDAEKKEEDRRPWKELPEIEEPPVIEEKVLTLEEANFLQDCLDLSERIRRGRVTQIEEEEDYWPSNERLEYYKRGGR